METKQYAKIGGFGRINKAGNINFEILKEDLDKLKTKGGYYKLTLVRHRDNDNTFSIKENTYDEVKRKDEFGIDI